MSSPSPLSVDSSSPSSDHLPLPPFFVVSLALRLLALLHIWVSFQNYRQFTILYSSKHGIQPLSHSFRSFNSLFLSSPLKYIRVPSLYWLTYHSDSLSRMIDIIGMINGFLLFIGHPFTPLCFLLQHSLVNSTITLVGTAFPWEALITEGTFMAAFAPPLNCMAKDIGYALVSGDFSSLLSLSSPTSPLSFSPTSPPLLPIIHFSFRFLLFRLMFGFGKFKFIGASTNEFSYLKGFLINQPILSPIGYFLEKFPLIFLIFSLGGMFIVEIIFPFFYLFFGDYWGNIKNISVISTMGLMIGIQMTGNFGWFNILTIIICLTQVSLSNDPSTHSNIFTQLFNFWDGRNIYSIGSGITYLIFLFHFFISLLYLPLNSWCSHSFAVWPQLILPNDKIIKFFGFLNPFNILHSYGVFHPQSAAGIHIVPVIEGSKQEWNKDSFLKTSNRMDSMDGGGGGVKNPFNQSDDENPHWEEYEYQYYISSCFRRPQFIAPYHPRIDQAIVYEAMGLSWNGFFGSSFTPLGVRYDPNTSMLDKVVQRLLEGDPQMNKIFHKNPFQNPSSPPKQIRISLYLFTPCSMEEWRTTGRYFHRRYCGEHIPPTSLSSYPLVRGEKYLPVDNIIPPECLHPDWLPNWTPHIPALSTLLDHQVNDQSPQHIAEYFTEQNDEKNQRKIDDFFKIQKDKEGSDPYERQILPDINASPSPFEPITSLPSSKEFPLTVYLSSKPRLNTLPTYQQDPSFQTSPSDITEFFTVFLPSIQQDIKDLSKLDLLSNGDHNTHESISLFPREDDWSRIVDKTQLYIVNKYSINQRLKYRMIHHRIALMLCVKIHPLLYPSHTHRLVPTWIHLWFICMAIVLQGTPIIHTLLNRPILIRKVLSNFCLSSPEYGLYAVSLYWHRHIVSQCQKGRLLVSMMGGGALKSEPMAPGWIEFAYSFLSKQYQWKECYLPVFHKPMRADEYWRLEWTKDNDMNVPWESHGLMKKYSQYNKGERKNIQKDNKKNQ